ncbi:YggS family pyridoxal phosphate enzyme [Kwoniella bestiolae CBS 10118]|uniref:Pyridoxal phosphate homeostasis protein n=1 Tax=Kwoniella bestiolae CBS 10118 TaxID=1296100 RepID=A0AAJ8KFI5_9TREE
MSSPISLEYTPDRAEELKENTQSVQKEIDQAASSGSKPRLVAISKIKPASDIKALYDAGYRHFGENYIQEMVDKAEVVGYINWHFIGSLQSNKSKLAASIPNLYVLETLSSIKVADLLQKSLSPDRTAKLNVYIQINTSEEDAKSGLPSLAPGSDGGEVVDLAVHVIEKCPGLNLLGLMTIGSFESSHDASKPNPDFETLKSTRKELARILQGRGFAHRVEELELSMGMSADFVQAVKEGSSSVRVGTRIFGERAKKVPKGA